VIRKRAKHALRSLVLSQGGLSRDKGVSVIVRFGLRVTPVKREILRYA